jgi:hypothetical protein
MMIIFGKNPFVAAFHWNDVAGMMSIAEPPPAKREAMYAYSKSMA